MARKLTDEEVAQQRADANLRQRIKKLFSQVPEARLDAQEALKEAWVFDEPSFRMEELAVMDPQASTLAAARRDGVKEIITWLTKI